MTPAEIVTAVINSVLDKPEFARAWSTYQERAIASHDTAARISLLFQTSERHSEACRQIAQLTIQQLAADFATMPDDEQEMADLTAEMENRTTNEFIDCVAVGFVVGMFVTVMAAAENAKQQTEVH